MGQAEFAEWIEDHIAELATPTEKEAAEYKETFGGSVATPSEIMLLSRGLKIHAETRASSSIVLHRPDVHITTHVNAALDKARDATGLPTWQGAPEMNA